MFPVAKTLKKPPRKRTIKKPDSVESKDKDSLIKEGGDKRKAKTKQNMVVQPMLKNVDTQVFQNVTGDTKFVDKQQKETLSETQVEDFMVMESQVLEDLMSLSCETFKTSGEPDLSAVKQEKTDIELESSETKIKTISNKMPGQSLLNQDFINKSTLVQGNNLRVLKAKQTKPGVLNLVSTGDKLQQSDGQAVIGHILKSDNRPQEIVTTAGKKIIIQTSFAGKLCEQCK